LVFTVECMLVIPSGPRKSGSIIRIECGYYGQKATILGHAERYVFWAVAWLEARHVLLILPTHPSILV